MDKNAIQVLVGKHTQLNVQVQAVKKNVSNRSDGNASFAELMDNKQTENLKVWDPRLADLQSLQAQPVWNAHFAQLEPNEEKSSSHSNGDDFTSIIEAASEKYGVSEKLIRAVIQAESSFNPSATSSAGAKGLMQLMDGTAKGLGVTNSYDPEQNINGGTKYLAMLLQKYKGEEKVALAAYNAGLGRVDRLGIATNLDFEQKRSLLPSETQNYVNKVLAYIT